MESERMINKQSNRPQRKALQWESTLTDKILFPLTALIFLILFAVLLFGNAGNKADGHPSYEATCWTPVEFSGAWVLYTNQHCSSKEAQFYNSNANFRQSEYVTDPETNETVRNDKYPKIFSRDDVFPTNVAQTKSTIKSSKLLLLMVMLSLIPPIAWHLLKGIDGNGLATLEYRKRGTYGRGLAGYLTMIWYVICQILMLIIIFVIFYNLHVHETNFKLKKNELYEPNKVDSVSDMVDNIQDALQSLDPDYDEPKWVEPGRVDVESVLCGFKIRRLGNNVHRYSVQCDLKRTVAGSYEYLVLITSKYWTILVLAAIIVNGLITVSLALIAFAKNSVLERYLGYKVDSAFAALVNWPDVYVGLLASRRGETRRVVEILTSASESDNERELKHLN